MTATTKPAPGPSTTSMLPTTTTAEHEAIQALRRYFVAYAYAVQHKDPDSILPYLDPSNAVGQKAVTDGIRLDIQRTHSGARTLGAIYLEFDRLNSHGDEIASVRAIYTDEDGTRGRSFGMVKVNGVWLLAAIADQGFQS
jgi:hypothetical protein